MNLIHNGTATSIAAAASVQSAAATMRETVLQAIRAASFAGLTREEIERQTGLAGNSVRPRVSELLAAGAITPSGEIRRTASNRPAEVLVAVESMP